MDFREYIGFSPTSENITIKESVIRPIDQSSYSNDSDNELIVEIEAVHAYPYVTKNSTRYSYQGLEDSLSEWTHPYNIPIIMHHNDQDGQIIGRAIDARLGDSERLVGSKALFITAKILDEKAQKDIKSGLLSTVSIGMTGHDVRCSICGQDLNEGPCGHVRGESYDGQTCCWDFFSMSPIELSYVIVPSDKYAKNIKVYDDGEYEQQSSTPSNLSIPQQGETGTNIRANESMDKEKLKVQEPETEVKTEVEGKETAAEVEVPETKTPEVEETPEIKGEEKTEIEELKGQIAELIKSNEALSAKVSNLADDLLAYKSEARKETASLIEGKEKLEEALKSVQEVKAGFDTFKTESEEKVKSEIASVKESFEDKIKTLDLTNSTVNDPNAKNNKSTEVQVKEAAQQLKSITDVFNAFYK